MTAGGAAGNAIRPQLVGGENPHGEMLVPAGTIAIDQPAGERACVHCRRSGKWPVHRLRAPVIRRSPPLLHSSRCKAPCSPKTPKLTPPWCASRITPTSGRDSNKPGQPWRTDGSWLGKPSSERSGRHASPHWSGNIAPSCSCCWTRWPSGSGSRRKRKNAVGARLKGREAVRRNSRNSLL